MNTIHLGNYEEFFILYMDNELSEDQMKMVDDFLAAHPDLKAEFGILMSTKLPLEEFSFDKKDLLAENMKLSSIDEELLLYIDNELPSDQKKTVELELASNKDYQLQHQVLLQTKLDSAEKIIYPNKKELYRRTEKVISFKVWMRVAAAVVIIAISSVVYFKNPPSIVSTTDNNQNTPVTNAPVQNQAKQNEPVNNAVIPSDNAVKNNVAVSNKNYKKEGQQTQTVKPKDINTVIPADQSLASNNNQNPQQDQSPERLIKTSIQPGNAEKLMALNTSKDIINSGSVTSVDPVRTSIVTPETNLGETENRKGSLKGFLRKATRMIEKRTGIDPTNGNGDLLIGAVAINLK
jgi:hypothetical protein